MIKFRIIPLTCRPSLALSTYQNSAHPDPTQIPTIPWEALAEHDSDAWNDIFTSQLSGLVIAIMWSTSQQQRNHVIHRVAISVAKGIFPTSVTCKA